MLIDDNPDDNFFLQREIRKADIVKTIVVHTSGLAALDYLKSKQQPHADLIFLDINMPRMNGWEFLEQYNLLDKELQSMAIIIMLTTSDHPEDIKRYLQIICCSGCLLMYSILKINPAEFLP